jgi:adenylate cyclase
MDAAQLTALSAWITEAGLAGCSETELVKDFCERLRALGMPVARSGVFIDTLHPVHEGRIFRWDRDNSAPTVTEYGRTEDTPEADERWKRSPLYHLLQSGHDFMRRRLDPESEREFSVFPELRAAGMTDYVCLITRFGSAGSIGQMDCVYSSWCSADPKGFLDEHVELLRELARYLALAIKSASLARIAGTLVETYLGRDAGQRVLSGRIARGVADRIDAVLWFSDLRGYTRISDTAPPEQIIPLLNDYADAIISAINSAGGDVLKLVGDGTLAIFTGVDREHACRAALAAAFSYIN